MPAVYVVDACRTPIGKVKGALAGVRPDHLSATILSALLQRVPNLDRATIDDVYWGAANQAGEDNRNVARMAALLADLPVEIPGATLNRLCGSGMEAITAGARAIAAGEAEVIVAGGTESMTRAPFVMPRTDEAFPRAVEVADTRLGWRLVSPWMKQKYNTLGMGETAENVADKYGITRDRQDAFALRSHHNAAAAWAAGRFVDEVVAIDLPEGALATDEGVKGALTLEQLQSRRPAFRPEGSVTAGNSSPLNDGAAALLLVSEAALNRLGVDPLGRWVGGASAGVHPDYMGIGPVSATRKVLDRVGWSVQDLDLIEANEAFAAQALAVVDELKADPAKVNVNGGAIAIGHPLGCSGVRIVTTLLHELRRRGGGRGAATMCVGVGQGIASLFEV